MRPCEARDYVFTAVEVPEYRLQVLEVGFPAMKLRDRHFEDKHSPSSRLYRCLFIPCNYSSKRKSNLNQHLEKVSPANYARSKKPGRSVSTTRASTQVSHTMPTSIADGNLPFSESHVLPEHCGDDDVAPATLDDEHDDPAITTPTASRPFSRVAANSSGDEGTHPPPFREPERWQSIPDTADDSAGMPSSSRDSMDQAHAFGAAHEPILVRSGPTAMDVSLNALADQEKS